MEDTNPVPPSARAAPPCGERAAPPTAGRRPGRGAARAGDLPTRAHAGTVAASLADYTGGGEDARVARVAARVGAVLRPQRGRRDPGAVDARRGHRRVRALMGWRRVGIATCIGLRGDAAARADPPRPGARADQRLLQGRERGQGESRIPDAEKVRPGTFEPACNPVAQARILNEVGTDLNVIVGLCVGHDILFTATRGRRSRRLVEGPRHRPQPGRRPLRPALLLPAPREGAHRDPGRGRRGVGRCSTATRFRGPGRPHRAARWGHSCDPWRAAVRLLKRTDHAEPPAPGARERAPFGSARSRRVHRDAREVRARRDRRRGLAAVPPPPRHLRPAPGRAPHAAGEDPAGRAPPGPSSRRSRTSPRSTRGFAHVTTRQNFQLHFVTAHGAEAAMRRMAEAGITTRGV